jgi:hypothetical protein
MPEATFRLRASRAWKRISRTAPIAKRWLKTCAPNKRCWANCATVRWKTPCWPKSANAC